MIYALLAYLTAGWTMEVGGWGMEDGEVFSIVAHFWHINGPNKLPITSLADARTFSYL